MWGGQITATTTPFWGPKPRILWFFELKKCFRVLTPRGLCGQSANVVYALFRCFCYVAVSGGFNGHMVTLWRGGMGDVVTMSPC